MPSAPAALVLVSAVYEFGDPSWVTLVFDRAIDISALNGSAITVNDPVDTITLWNGTGGAALTGPTTLELTLNYVGDSSGSSVRMSATGATGIVAVDDGGTWAGVTELELPWP